MNIHFPEQWSPGRFLGGGLLTPRLWILKTYLTHSTIYIPTSRVHGGAVDQCSPKGILSILFIFSHLSGKIFSFHLHFGVICMFSCIDLLTICTCIICVDPQIKFLSTSLLWLFSLLIRSLCIQPLFELPIFFPVFHLSFNLIFDVFAKENLKMYYAFRFIHFSLVISYFSNKNIVILSFLRLSWTCLLSIFFSCG